MASSIPVDKQKQPKLDVEKYLSTAISATPGDLHHYFESFEDLHSRKYAPICSHSLSRCVLTRVLILSTARLWHQMTLKLIEFFDDPLSQQYQVDVYDRFVRDFASKLNPLKLVEMGVKVSRQIDSKQFTWGSYTWTSLINSTLRPFGLYRFPHRHRFKNRQRQITGSLRTTTRNDC